MQTKRNPLGECQLKFASDSSGEFEGYASVFNSNDAVNDTILPGAFTMSLGGGTTPKMFINHDHSAIPVGDWLKMEEDDYGLKALGRIDMNHKDGPSVYSALKRGAMDGISVGFLLKKGDYEWKENNDGRVIKNADLKEASIVNFPAEGGARISDVKHLIEDIHDLKSLEALLRDEGGFSRAAAKALASRMKQLSHRDGDDELRKTIAEQEELLDALKRRIANLNGQLLALKIGGLK
jgi:HK97 family phage prohead protease